MSEMSENMPTERPVSATARAAQARRDADAIADAGALELQARLVQKIWEQIESHREIAKHAAKMMRDPSLKVIDKARFLASQESAMTAIDSLLRHLSPKSGGDVIPEGYELQPIPTMTERERLDALVARLEADGVVPSPPPCQVCLEREQDQ